MAGGSPSVDGPPPRKKPCERAVRAPLESRLETSRALRSARKSEMVQACVASGALYRKFNNTTIIGITAAVLFKAVVLESVGGPGTPPREGPVHARGEGAAEPRHTTVHSGKRDG